MFVNVCLRMYSLNVPNAMYMCILTYLLKYMCIVYLYIVFISLHSSLPFGPLCSTLQGTKTSYKSNCRLIDFFLSFSLCGYCFLWRFKTFLCAKVKKVFLSFFFSSIPLPTTVLWYTHNCCVWGRESLRYNTCDKFSSTYIYVEKITVSLAYAKIAALWISVWRHVALFPALHSGN